MAVQQACQWGSPEKPYGNYAPLNLGVGYSAGNAWLSIFQNQPTTNAKLDFTVELVGDNGGYDNLVGRCKYENGKYCNGDNYENCSPTGNGCTVSLYNHVPTIVINANSAAGSCFAWHCYFCFHLANFKRCLPVLADLEISHHRSGWNPNHVKLLLNHFICRKIPLSLRPGVGGILARSYAPASPFEIQHVLSFL